MSGTLTEQEKFWKGEFGAGYMERNASFDIENAKKAWRLMLAKAKGIQSVLECGSNIGRNLQALKGVLPQADLSLIEINEEAYWKAVKSITPKHAFNGPILGTPFEPRSFDLTFTCGVLIHISPENLEANMRKMFDLSKKYVLVCEYFSRSPQEVSYHGHSRRLFKCDFGKYFLEKFSVKILDYGFLWSHEYEAGGFDDMTWWLFEKKS